jgi:hypothetical protein
MNKILAISVATALCLGVVGHAVAGNNPDAQLALDMRAFSKTRTCATLATSFTSCSAINRSVTAVSGPQTLDVIPVLYQFTGVTGVAFGVDWQTSYAAFLPSWTLCGDLNIVRSDGAHYYSIAVTYSTCKTPSGAGAGVAPGFLRFNSYGLPTRFHLANDDGGVPRTVDCSFNGDEMHTLHDGFLNGEAPGPSDLDPCTAGPTATQATTWSGVKALYR